MYEWTERRLEDVVRLKRGFDLATRDRRPGPFPVVGSAGISGWHDEGPVPGPALVLGRAGSSMGVASYCEPERFWPLNTSLFVEDFKGNDPRFIFHLFQVTDLTGYNSGSAQPMLNRNYIRDVIFLLPGIDEQRAISDVLKALGDKIAVNDRIGATMDLVLKARFAYISRDASHAVRLRDLVEFKYGKALKDEDRKPGIVPVFGGNGVSGWHDRSLDDGPGIIVGRKGANAGSVSWSQGAFWPIDTSFYVKQLSSDAPLEFLFFLLDAAGLRNLVGDSAIPGLNRDIALSCPVRVPDPDAIRLFTETVRPLLALGAQVAEESRSIAELRDTLLPKLMSGQIRVRDAEEVIEDVT
jgi:type I restriction enzyme S subunit